MMKKSFLYIFIVVILVSLTGCKKEETTVEYTEEEIAGAIAGISNDEDGNVLIKLADGRLFVLDNLKGEKGNPGEKGERGEQGESGKNGLNGSNGQDGRYSYGDIVIELNPADVNIDSIFENNNNIDIDIVIDKTKSFIYKIAR